MSTVKQIESALERLPLEDLQAIHDGLEDFMEDQLEVSDEFKAKIQRANQEFAVGVVARMAPDCNFMPGQQAAGLFSGHRADAEAANAIARELRF